MMIRPQQSEVRYPCSVEGCPQDFRGNNEMTRHVQEYHGEIKQCPHCPYKSKRRLRVQNHMDKEHYHKVVLEVGDDSFSHDCSPTMGAIASQSQNGGAQQTTTAYDYSEPSVEYRYTHADSSVSIHSLESNLSSASNGFVMPSAVDPTSQTNSAELGMSYGFHPPMTLPPTLHNNTAAEIPTFCDPNTSSNGRALGPDAASREQDLGTEGNGHNHGKPT